MANLEKNLSVPSGIWPSLWVMVITGTLVGIVALVGMFITNVYSEESPFVLAYRIPCFTESVIEAHMDYALGSEEYNNVIFLGGSATLAGIVINSFEDATGLRAYNFGTAIDIGPDGHLEIFRAYIKSHPKPELLVYTAYPRDIGDESFSDVHMRDRFVQAYGPVLQSRETRPVRDPTFYFSKGYWWLRALANNGTTHPFDVPRGARPSHNQVAPSLAESRGYHPYPEGNILYLGYLDEIDGIPVSPWYDSTFQEMAKLARDNDIGLMIWIMPIPVPNNPVGDDLVIAWAEEFICAFPEVSVEGLPLQRYDLDL